MKLLVCGSRDIIKTKENFLKFTQRMDYLCKVHKITEIVSGGAKGPDSWSEEYAKEKNIPFKLFLPEWDTHGKSAGILRNIEMVNYIIEDGTVAAFWDKKSKGTKHTIDYATKHNLYVHIFPIISNEILEDEFPSDT